MRAAECGGPRLPHPIPGQGTLPQAGVEGWLVVAAAVFGAKSTRKGKICPFSVSPHSKEEEIG